MFSNWYMKRVLATFAFMYFLCPIHFGNADEPTVYSCKVASNHTDQNFTGLPEPGDELLLIITSHGALVRDYMSGFSLIFDDIFESKFMMYRAASIEDTQVQSLHFNMIDGFLRFSVTQSVGFWGIAANCEKKEI